MNAPPPPPVIKKAMEAASGIEIDLPAPVQAQLPSIAATLPTTRARTKLDSISSSFEFELPKTSGETPRPASFALDSPARPGGSAASASTKPHLDDLGFGEVDLPTLGASLPVHVGTAGGAELPTTANVLPAPAPALPMTANVLPTPAPPTFSPSLPPSSGNAMRPAKASPASTRPAAKGAVGDLDFGDLDLGGGTSDAPQEADDGFGMLDLPPGALAGGPPPARGRSSMPPSLGAADLESVRPPPPPRMPPPPQSAPFPPPQSASEKAVGGMAFGEVDLGGGSDEASIPTEAPRMSAHEAVLPQAPVSIQEVALPQVSSAEVTPKEKTAKRPQSVGKVILVTLAILLIGGGALELTALGAFGRFAITDALRAGDYARALAETIRSAETRMGADTFMSARSAVDDAFAQHARRPRVRALAAYAALVTFSYEARFGADADRSARARQILAELAAHPETPFYSAALSAQDAIGSFNLEMARSGLDAASKTASAKPILEDILLIHGEVELAAKNGAAATASFTRALELRPSARARYGLARAAALKNDDATHATELSATLALTPLHPAALIDRAFQKAQDRDDAAALVDLAVVASGAAQKDAAPKEVAEALAAAGFIHFRRGRAAAARAAFDAALKLAPNDASALMGQGIMLSSENRYTEALSRFDTAVQNAPTDPEAIALDAMTKVRLERLKEAKEQVVAARALYPKEMRLAYALAVAERGLGNRADAEKAFRESIALAKPKALASVEPFVALAGLLAEQDRRAEAAAVIAEASTKLAESPALECALAEFLAAQGEYDDAVLRYKRALDLDPQDLATRYKLGVIYRRMRRMGDAAAQFDGVLAVDREYPGLAMERGLLFEETGDTERALDQFKAALAQAPNDPDLMLRAGAAYVAIDRPDDGLPMLRAVLEKRANSAEANHYLGRALFAKAGSSSAEALRFLKRATDLDPNRAEYHMYVAWAANDSSNRDALGLAHDEIERAYALDKLSGDVFWQRGVLERKQGALEDAIRDERRALQLKPSRIEAHAALAECFEDRNQQAEALAEWQIAVTANDRKPAWRYRYGKLLLESGASAEAAKHLAFAATEAEKLEIHPGWYTDAQFQAGEALRKSGQRKEAIEKYKKFLEVAPTSSPDRRDAIAALSQLGAPYVATP